MEEGKFRCQWQPLMMEPAVVVQLTLQGRTNLISLFELSPP